tara:strand:+ start:163 stop:597 length:435 start_codon:yes stop_codon:yes gene_type:complete
MLTIKNTLITSSFILALTNVVFFGYGFNKIHNVAGSLKSDCRSFLTYNIGIMSLYAFSLVVFFSYIFCSNCISHILYILNAVALTSMGIDRYVRKKTICDYECQMNCGDLVNLGNKIETFFIVDLSILALASLVILIIIGKKIV